MSGWTDKQNRTYPAGYKIKSKKKSLTDNFVPMLRTTHLPSKQYRCPSRRPNGKAVRAHNRLGEGGNLVTAGCASSAAVAVTSAARGATASTHVDVCLV